MNNKQGLEQLIHRLADAFAEQRRKTGIKTIFDGRQPPTSPTDIANFENAQAIRLPPTYRMFLTLHNGWVKYRRVYTLMGVDGVHMEKFIQNKSENLAIFRKAWKDKLSESAEEYLENKIIFGTDFAGSLLYFDPQRAGSDMEYPVIERDAHGKVILRHPSFIAMLESDLEFVEHQIGRSSEY